MLHLALPPFFLFLAEEEGRPCPEEGPATSLEMSGFSIGTTFLKGCPGGTGSSLLQQPQHLPRAEIGGVHSLYSPHARTGEDTSFLPSCVRRAAPRLHRADTRRGPDTHVPCGTGLRTCSTSGSDPSRSCTGDMTECQAPVALGRASSQRFHRH